MAKLTINDVTSGFYSTSALNAAFTAIEGAIENTVSRDGTTPNNMSGNLDMNSHRILNLPVPVDTKEPARLQDIVNSISGVTQANFITFVPYSTIAATTVQGAIQEVVDDAVVALATKQPVDTTLTSLANYNTDGILVQSAVDSFVGRTITAGTEITVTNGNGVLGNPVITNNMTLARQTALGILSLGE